MEHAPIAQHSDRTVVAHLQLMLANFGIELAIVPSEFGWSVRASSEPAGYEQVSGADLDIHDPYDAVGGHHHGESPASEERLVDAAAAAEPSGARSASG